MIAVVDYGAGNVCSVMHALEHIGAPSILTREEGEIARADAVILPGVGAFGDAMAQLGASGTVAALERYLKTGRPLLGICIGEQLLFDRSEESPGSPGLAWLRGSVRRIPAAPERKVPTWAGTRSRSAARTRSLRACRRTRTSIRPLLYVDAADKSCVLARVEYGVPMDVAVRRDNLCAVQFHPEKSGECGLQLLKNFARCARRIPCLPRESSPAWTSRPGAWSKGVNFVNLTERRRPVACAEAYDRAGADELTFLDITASSDARRIMLDTVRAVARAVYIPFTVGGGIQSIQDYSDLLHAGAEKVSVNSYAVAHPEILAEAARKFGSQCVVLAIDAKWNGRFFEVYTHGGRRPTGMDAVAWAKRAVPWARGRSC